MTVSGNTIKAEGLGGFFKDLGKISAKASTTLATNLLKNPGRALDITANTATEAASRNPKNVKKSLPERITFYNTCTGLYLGKIVLIIPYKWNKNLTEFAQVHH